MGPNFFGCPGFTLAVTNRWIEVEKIAAATRAPRCFASVSRCEQSRAPGGDPAQRGRVAGRRPCPYTPRQGALGYLLSIDQSVAFQI
jgi:hypothetical protein